MNVRVLFTIAALFNIVLALALLFAWPQMQALLQLTPADSSNAFLKNVVAVLVLTFGYGYYLIGRDPVTYRPYIALGAIGKLLVVAVALPVLLGDGPGKWLALLAMGDLVFAALFIHFARRHPAFA